MQEVHGSNSGHVMTDFCKLIQFVYILSKINLAISDVTYIFDHLKAILDISLI